MQPFFLTQLFHQKDNYTLLTAHLSPIFSHLHTFNYYTHKNKNPKTQISTLSL